MPGFQKLSDARIVFVNDRRVVEINDMVMRPSMICNSGAFAAVFKIPSSSLSNRNSLASYWD